MFCPNCGTNITDNAKFCPKCGTSINPSAPTRNGRREFKKPTAGNSTLGTSKTSQQGVQSTLEDQVVSTGSKFREKLTPKIIGIIVAAVVVIAAIIVLIVVLNNRSSTSDYGSDNDLSKTSEGYKNPTETATATENELTLNPDDTEEDEDYENTEIQQLRSTLLEEKESFPVPDGRQIKKASKYRIDGSLASETEYYEDGTVSSVTEYEADGSMSLYNFYDESGRPIEEHHYVYPVDHAYYEYFEDGYVKHIYGSSGSPFRDNCITLEDGTTIHLSDIEDYTYDENGNLTQFISWTYVGGTMGGMYINEIYECIYNDNNNLLELYYFKNDTSRSIDAKTSDEIGDIKEGDPYWQFTYDESNRMTTAKVHEFDSYDYVYYTYTYDENNNLTVKKTYDADDLSLRNWEEYIYNDDNLLIQMNRYDSTDALIATNTYTHSFDEDGREISISLDGTSLIDEYAYWDNGNMMLSYRSNSISLHPNRDYLTQYKDDSESGYTIYWDNGNIETEENHDSGDVVKYDYFGNVTYDIESYDIYNYTYTYDESGNILTSSVFVEETIGNNAGSTTREDYTYVNEYYE